MSFLSTTPSTPQIYTLSLHDALPISMNLPKYELYETGSQIRRSSKSIRANIVEGYGRRRYKRDYIKLDRKSTRLNSSHVAISYAVFCLKKKTKKIKNRTEGSKRK